MEKLIKDLNDLLVYCNGLSDRLNQALHEASEEKILLSALRKKLNLQKQNQDGREATIKEQESRLETRDNLDKRANDVNDRRSELQMEIDQFNKSKEDIQKQLDDQRANLEIREQKLGDSQKALDEEKRTYKQIVIAEVEKAHSKIKLT